ncbi:MAG: hypothetical protein K2X27_28575 [Candidatus Obscuribacterales bacterium]|nr:hypothetical protein [Candidatus Obscuribacterales bacterium]
MRMLIQTKEVIQKRFLLISNAVNFLFFAVSIFLFSPAASAFENEVEVSLFRAVWPIKRLIFKGSFKIVRPLDGKIFSDCELSVPSAGYFELRSCKYPLSRPLKIHSQSLELASNGRALCLGPSLSSLRRYKGSLKIRALPDASLSCLNLVSLRDYVSSVVGSETQVEFPKEALKAQSVLVQTSMLHYKKGDQLNDSTEKQAYLGADYVSSAVKEAVRESWGERLLCQGRPVPIYFHASCAGGTSSSRYFSDKIPTLKCDRAVKCEYCRDAQFWKASRQRIAAAIFAKAFPDGVPEIVKWDESGRPFMLKFPSGKQQLAYSFWLQLGQKLGWDRLPGSRFEIRKLQDSSVELSSRGGGHGVGLCQWGAAGLARQGAEHKRILEFYFPGAVLTKP